MEEKITNAVNVITTKDKNKRFGTTFVVYDPDKVRLRAFVQMLLLQLENCIIAPRHMLYERQEDEYHDRYMDLGSSVIGYKHLLVENFNRYMGDTSGILGELVSGEFFQLYQMYVEAYDVIKNESIDNDILNKNIIITTSVDPNSPLSIFSDKNNKALRARCKFIAI